MMTTKYKALLTGPEAPEAGFSGKGVTGIGGAGCFISK